MSPVAQPDFIGPQGPPPLTLPQLASKYAMPLGAAALGAMGAGYSGEYDDSPPDWWQEGGGGNFGESLPVYRMRRSFRGLSSPEDYFTYGQPGAPQSGQHLFITPADPFPWSLLSRHRAEAVWPMS